MDVLAKVYVLLSNDNLFIVPRMLSIVIVGIHFLDIHRQQGLARNDRGLLIFKKEMISFQQDIIDKDLGHLIHEQSHLLILPVSGVVVCARSILWFVGNNLSDELNSGVILIPVLAAMTFYDDGLQV